MKTRIRLCRIALVALATGTGGDTAVAQGRASVPDRTVGAAERAAIVDWVATRLQDTYVFPEVADRMVASLREHRESGAWDGLTDIRLFVQAVSDDLEAVSGDRHIGLQYAPQPSSRAVRTDPEEEARRRDARLQDLQYSNFMFQKVEILDGNVGYLRFDRFYDPASAGPTAIAALQFLAYTDAVIIDLRHNGGGHAGMIRLLLSYFFDEPTHINSWYDRPEDRIVQSWTSDHVGGRRLSAADLYVLTSRSTFSAAEEFAYDLQALGRATVVGETTGGGGHTVQLVRSDDLELELRVPNGRAINPVTGTNWERIGVAPDVAAPADDALEVAHTLALRQLYDALAADSPRRDYLGWITEYRETRRSPAPLPSVEVLQAYAGLYGPAEVRYRDGGLFFLGPGAGGELPLLRLEGNVYVIDGIADIRVAFEHAADGRVTALHGVFPGGRRDRFPKR